MNPRSAAHRSDVAPPLASAVRIVTSEDVVETVICARFFANRSLSPWSTFSRRFIAPGRLFMLFLLIMLTCSPAAMSAVVARMGESSSTGSAAANESRVATSFLFGRRLRGFLDAGLVILDISAACFICLLSLLVDGKSEELEVEGCVMLGEDEDDFFTADLRRLDAF